MLSNYSLCGANDDELTLEQLQQARAEEKSIFMRASGVCASGLAGKFGVVKKLRARGALLVCDVAGSIKATH